MRTKTLLLAATALAVGLATSSAQPVYSANVVGYINQVIPAGFTMIANQLDTGTNTLGNLLPTPPDDTKVYKFTGTGYDISSYLGGWNHPEMTLNPGEGAFIYNPGPSPITNAFIGTVLQGTFTNVLPVGFSMQGYPVPVTGALNTQLGCPIGDDDHVYLWDGTNYVIYNYLGGWSGLGEPTINVGQSFFIYHNNAGLTNWVISFTVQ